MSFSEKLLIWFDTNKRPLPWRAKINVYHTWLSEVMSQQTTMAVVVPRFLEFIAELPTLEDLAQCDEITLRRLWSGLGYYARARNLKKAAVHIVDHCQGKFPTTYSQWLTVSGCGPYTASVISSICFNEPVACVDGNVVRVLSRVKGFADVWTRQGQKVVQKWATESIDTKRPGDFNQAMMELGALVCRKQNPQCVQCPLQNDCVAFQQNLTAALPPIKPKADLCNVQLSAVVVCRGERQKQYYIGDRTNGRFLSNTHGFAVIDQQLADKLKLALDRLPGVETRIVKSAFQHTITNHKIKTDVLVINAANIKHSEYLQNISHFLNFSNGAWVAEQQLENTLSTAFDKKAFKSLVRQKKPTV